MASSFQTMLVLQTTIGDVLDACSVTSAILLHLLTLYTVLVVYFDSALLLAAADAHLLQCSVCCAGPQFTELLV